MGHDLLSILELWAACAAGFCLVGFVAFLVAVHKARDAFRSKGYLRPLWGKRLFRFLLFKEYDYFEDSGTRFFFGISHMCLLGMIILAMAIVVFVGCELLLGGMGAVPSASSLRPDT